MTCSMTGFGQAEEKGREVRLSCEVRSVNHRFLALKLRLPGVLSRFEVWVDKQVRSRVSRGAVELFVHLSAPALQAETVLHPEVADRYLEAMRAYQRSRGIEGEVPAARLFQLPGVFAAPDPALALRSLQPGFERVVAAALDRLVRGRQREGARLERALRREVRRLQSFAARIARRVPRVVAAQQKKLRQRVDQLLGDASLSLDRTTLAREVALLADRSDVTEELDRLRSHLEEFGSILDREEPIGRALEFLVQEVGREVQTLGAKSQDQGITTEVLRAKGALEKLREQVQNIE